MGSKTEPGTYDCYANALPDEPMFVLLGRDPRAPEAVRLWAKLRSADIDAGRRPRTDRPVVAEAYTCSSKMEAWREANEGKWRPQPWDGRPPGGTPAGSCHYVKIPCYDEHRKLTWRGSCWTGQDGRGVVVVKPAKLWSIGAKYIGPAAVSKTGKASVPAGWPSGKAPELGMPFYPTGGLLNRENGADIYAASLKSVVRGSLYAKPTEHLVNSHARHVTRGKAYRIESLEGDYLRFADDADDMRRVLVGQMIGCPPPNEDCLA